MLNIRTTKDDELSEGNQMQRIDDLFETGGKSNRVEESRERFIVMK